jgi:hypothetical protein
LPQSFVVVTALATGNAAGVPPMAVLFLLGLFFLEKKNCDAQGVDENVAYDMAGDVLLID